MRDYTFHWEIRSVIAQFEDAFNDIVIKRYNIDREPQDQLHVNFVFAPKQRVLSDLVNKNQHIKIPTVAIVPAGIRRNVNRVFNKIEGSYHTNSPVNSAWMHLLQPVPVDISINMSIISRFQQDVDQILTNFIPYCDPYVVVSWKWPDVIPWADFEIRSHVVWSENVAFQYPVDITNTVPYRVIADTGFTIEGWMFKNSPNPQGPIYVIDHSFTAVSEMEDFKVMQDYESIYNTEVFITSARPQLTQCTPYMLYTSAVRSFEVIGYMLDFVDTFYLSGTPNMFDTSTIGMPYISGYSISAGVTSVSSEGGFRYFDIFATVSSLSGMYPGFSGIQLSAGEWDVDSQNMITFTVSAINTGYFDIIAVNAAGYGKLTRDAIRSTTNPYPVGSVDYNNYVEPQHPSVSGVQVLSI